MNRPQLLLLAVVLLRAIVARSLQAQTTVENVPACAPPSCSDPLLTVSEKVQLSIAEQNERYAGALDGMGVVSLVRSTPRRLLFGVSVSGGWDGNPDTVNNGASSGFYIVSPYVGILASTPKSEAFLQYRLTAMGYDSRYSSQVLNAGSSRIILTPSERWRLDLDVTGNYGQNAVRLLGAQQTVLVGDLPAAGPDAASYLANNGTVIDLNASIGATYRISPRNSLQLQAANSFTHFAGYQHANGVAAGTIGFARRLSPVTDASVYLENFQYYGSLRCESYGTGIGIEWRPGENTAVSLRGGPQFNAPECGAQQGFAYSMSVNQALSGASGIYLLASRRPGSSYLGPGLWQDSISGGYSRRITNKSAIHFDLTYLRSNGAGTLGSYNSTFLNGAYDHGLGGGLSTSFTYRAYIDGSGGTYIDRNLAMFSVNWTPNKLPSLTK